ncbi:uncharacterized protein LOC143591014 [Bidens hawaiensis]|uniref:uncharacterized protein LOC143591014 n=1 Tax=Bidens hawaiensis TaxID=980011 RepID=UPI004049CC48
MPEPMDRSSVEETEIKPEEEVRVEDDNDEEFYERIEAPKFVDFTKPIPFAPMIGTGSALGLGVTESTRRRSTLKRSLKTLFLELWQQEVPISSLEEHYAGNTPV